MKRAWRAAGFAALLLVGFGSLGGAPVLGALPQPPPAPPARRASVEVKIDNFAFTPAAVTVAVGTTVEWVNRDDIPHNVVSTEQVWKSKTLDTDEKFSYTFAKAGTYPYFCSLHPKMTGTVIVR